MANPFGFTGHEHDSESGLIYAKARFYDPEIGVFLSQDPAAGELTNPPSLHQYLYAFQNPTVYVDPDGRIGILKGPQERVQEGGVETASELSGEIEEKLTEAGGAVGAAVSEKIAVTLGVLAAGAEMLAGAIGLVNTGVNVVVAGVAPDSEIGQEAAEELNETINSVLDTVDVIKEDPIGVGVAILKGAGETVEGVFEGDSESITRATAFVAEALTPTPGGTAKRIKKGLDKAAEVVGAIGDLNRQRRRLQGRRPGGGRSRGPDRRPDRGPDSKSPDRRPDRPESETPNLDESGAKAESRSCFVAGTLVATEEGLRPIESVRIGDRVWARSEETGEVRLREVVELFRTPDQVVYTLELEAEDGTVETLGVTAEHPFWVKGRGWVGAAELEPGDELVTNRDGWLRVRQVRGSPDRQVVYNFEVEVDHTYFVGETEAWVHNLCDEGRQRLLDNLAASRAAREARQKALNGGDGLRPKLRIAKSEFSESERKILRRAIAKTNTRLMEQGGARVGSQVKFKPHLSIRFAQEVLFPDAKLKDIRIGRLKPGSPLELRSVSDFLGFEANVDEIIPRLLGGKQARHNQRFLLERINKSLGPREERVLRELPKGTLIKGFDLEFF